MTIEFYKNYIASFELRFTERLALFRIRFHLTLFDSVAIADLSIIVSDSLWLWKSRAEWEIEDHPGTSYTSCCVGCGSVVA